jgi:RNA polymerase subunit RPABC4/transcription elongation factor Spt4
MKREARDDRRYCMYCDRLVVPKGGSVCPDCGHGTHSMNERDYR